MRDEVERGAAVDEVLRELRDRHVLLRKAVRDVREHAGPVGDLEVDVERRG